MSRDLRPFTRRILGIHSYTTHKTWICEATSGGSCYNNRTFQAVVTLLGCLDSKVFLARHTLLPIKNDIYTTEQFLDNIARNVTQ